MPVSRKRVRSGEPSTPRTAASRAGNRGALALVDNAPLQREAWTEFHTVQKRLDKVSKDLHRHEEVDSPAYEAWLHRTFPVQITNLRKLQEEVFAKGNQVEMVQAMGYLTGRPLKKLWREMKEREENPEKFRDDPSFEEQRKNAAPENEERWEDDEFEEEEEKGASRKSHYSRQNGDARSASANREGPAPSADAKAILPQAGAAAAS